MISNKVPCALLINDIHVSKDNISEFHKNWNEALSICQKEGIAEMFVGGDLWQSRSAQTLSTLLAVREALLSSDENGIDIIIAEGNHCKVDQESIYGYSHIFDQYAGVYVVDTFETYEIGENVALHIISYFPENGSFVDKLKELKATINFSASNTINILYIHQGINGALATSNDHELPTKLFKEFDKVLVGHYHDRCHIAGTNIEYIGSSRQHNFGEDEEKGYTILYSDGSTKFIKNNVNLRFKTIEMDAKNIQNELEKANVYANNPLYQIKAKIKCTVKDASLIDRNKLIESGIGKIDIISNDIMPSQTKAVSLDEKFDKVGIKKAYTHYCNEKKVSNVELGLKYLDKIN